MGTTHEPRTSSPTPRRSSFGSPEEIHRRRWRRIRKVGLVRALLTNCQARHDIAVKIPLFPAKPFVGAPESHSCAWAGFWNPGVDWNSSPLPAAFSGKSGLVSNPTGTVTAERPSSRRWLESADSDPCPKYPTHFSFLFPSLRDFSQVRFRGHNCDR